MDKHYSTEITSPIDDLRLRIRSFDVEITSNETIDHPEVHAHHFDEFHYFYQGTATLMLEGDKPDILLKRGDLCIIPAGLYHCLLPNGVERVVFEVEFESTKAHIQHNVGVYEHIRATLDHSGMPIVVNDTFTATLMNNYRQMQDNPRICPQTQNAIVLTNAVVHAINKQTPPEWVSEDDIAAYTSSLTDKRKAIIETHIDDYFNKKDGLRSLAAKLYLSERRTSEIVRNIMGMSFKDLIVRERMTVASILIKSEKYTLEQIAEFVGYHSYSGFYTAYKNYFGHPPTDDAT